MESPATTRTYKVAELKKGFGRGWLHPGQSKSNENPGSSKCDYDQDIKPSLGLESRVPTDTINQLPQSFDPISDDFAENPGWSVENLGRTIRGQDGREGVDVFIGNIPKKIEKEGLRNMLMQFGNLVPGKSIRQNRENEGRTWFTIVEFVSIADAFHAIAGLDKKPPYNLRLKYANLPRRKEDEPANSESSYYEVPKDLIEPPEPSGINGPYPRELKLPKEYQTETEPEDYPLGIFSTYQRSFLVDVNNQFLEKCFLAGVAQGEERVTQPPPVLSRDSPEPAQEPSEFNKHPSECNSSLAIPDKCKFCGYFSISVCADCEEPYCSQSCIKADSENHKLKCPPPEKSCGSGSAETNDGHHIKGANTFQVGDVSGMPYVADDCALFHQGELISRRTEKYENNVFIGLKSIPFCDEAFTTARGLSLDPKRPRNGSEQRSYFGKKDMQYHVMHYFSKNCQPVVTVTKEVGEDHLLGSLHYRNPGKDGYRDLGMISEALRKLQLVPIPVEQREPSQNVIVLLGDDIFRGSLTEDAEDRSTVVLWDVGRSVVMDTMYKAPSEVFDMPFVGVRIQLVEPLTDGGTLVGREFELTNVVSKFGFMTADFGNYGEAKVTPWAPREGEIRIRAVALPLECPVTITNVYSPQAVYLRPDTPEVEDMYCTIIQDLYFHFHSRHGRGSLEDRYHCGDLVAALFTNGTYQRAIIDRRRREIFHVTFLDFGCRRQDLLSRHLRPLPDHLKKIPAVAVKVGLKGISQLFFNDSALQSLRYLLLRSNKVRVKHEGDLSKVTLYDVSSGADYCRGIAALLSSTFGKAPTDVPKDFFLASDVVYMRWPSKVTGFVASIPPGNVQQFMFIGTTYDHHGYIKIVLTPQITHYCETLALKRYMPRDKEYVLVKRDAVWYRAIASPKKNFGIINTAEVFLVDHGNTGEVRLEDIRPMAREFVAVPALAKTCALIGMPPSNTLPRETVTEIQQLLLSVEELDVLKEVDSGQEDQVPQTCVVWVPSLVDPLAKLGVCYTKPLGL